MAHDCLGYHLPGSEYTWLFKQDEQLQTVAFKPRHVSNSGIALLEFARLGEGLALLEDYTVHNDIRLGRLVRVLDDYRITNTGFGQGMFATISDTPIVPAKIRLFLDFVAERVAGPELRFKAYSRTGGILPPAQ